MKKPATTIQISLLFFYLTCVPGCDKRAPESAAKRTEKVYKELGIVPKSKPVEPEVSSANSVPENKSADGESSSPRIDADRKMVDEPTVIRPSSSIDDVANLIEPWITADQLPQLPQEIWEVQYIGNTPIGYIRRKVSVNKILEDRLQIETESRTNVSLQGKPFVQRLKVSTTESHTGEVIRLEGSLETGDNKRTFEGSVSDGKMKLTGTNNGQAIPQLIIEWQRDCRGPFAVDQSMIRRPLVPNETRRLKYFDPIFARVVEGELKADVDFFKTQTMFGGSRDLLKVNNKSKVGDDTMEAVLWVDKKGLGYKSYMQSADIRSFRTEPIEAKILSSVFDLRAIPSKTVKLRKADQLMSNSSDTVSQTYRITHENIDPFRLFSDQANQHKKSESASSVDITVFRVGLAPTELKGVAVKPLPSSTTQADTDFIPSKSSIIQTLARAMVTSEPKLQAEQTNVFEKVMVIRQALFDRIRLKEFDNQIGTVSESMKNRDADCVEHALLFASVCRAMKIPARIALGMIFNRNKEEPEMKFHAWIEFHDGKGWVPSDSSDNQFPTSIDRIKVLESDFTDPNPYLDTLKVCQLLPELEISVLPQ